MAKDFYDKLKVISDIVKDNKVLVLMALTALGSGLTNLGQLIASEESAFLTTAMTDQITIMAKNRVKRVAKPNKPIIKHITKIIKQDCGKCKALLSDHVNKLH